MADIEEAILDYVSGMSITKASETNGVAPTTLNRHLKKLGLVRRYTLKKRTIPEPGKKKCGKMTVVSVSLEEYGRVVYRCRCECGREEKVRASVFLQGGKTECRSCKMTRMGNHSWKGCGKLSGTCWKSIKNHAVRKSRVLEFTITQQYAWDLYEQQSGKCALTGLDIPFSNKVEDWSFPSLDRIDSSKGYIPGNVQWVHKDVNLMKWNLSQERLVELCRLVAKKSGG